MTVLHRIATYHGHQPTQKGAVHAYRTTCGSQIATPLILAENQVITIGPKPHVQCAKCFADVKGRRVIEGDRPVANPINNPGVLASSPILNKGRGPIYDERGNMIPPAQETGGTNGQALHINNDKTLHIKDTYRGEDAVLRTEIDDLGALESNDFG
jgi:hypothetical protein